MSPATTNVTAAGQRTILRGGRLWRDGEAEPLEQDLCIEGGVVAELPSQQSDDDVVLDLDGRLVLPGLVNAHDQLDQALLPPLGDPPYASAQERAADLGAAFDDPGVRAAMEIALTDRLLLGGLRNLLSGVTAVAHHGSYHRALGRESFPVRVLSRYQFAHSPGLTPQLRKTYRSTDRRIPWLVRVAEGHDAASARELEALAEANVLRQNTVIVHGIALPPQEFARLAEVGVCVAWCPESNLRQYGVTAPVSELRAAGVRVGLGSDSPASGARDALSNLAVARREAALSDAALLDLATHRTAEVVRLPTCGWQAGDVADLLVCSDLLALLSGERSAVELLLVDGRARYGVPELLREVEPEPNLVPLRVDGQRRALTSDVGGRARSVLGEGLAAAWLSGIEWR